MCNGENGYTSQMRKIATGGYWQLLPNNTTFNQDLIKLTQDHHPDLIILQIQAPGIIDPSALKTCKELGAVIFNFNGDIRQVLPSWHYDIAPYCDSMLFTNMLDVHRIQQAGFTADWLELGVNPDIYKPDYPKVPSPEIVFMANNYGPGAFPLSNMRIETARLLKREFGDNFGVYGTGWNISSGEFTGSQSLEAQQYASAKIAINISHFDVERYSSDRLVRALASGIMVISHHYEKIEDSYTPGEHLITFKSLSQLPDLCKKYLADDVERKKIAEAGRKHVLENYTFECMANDIKKLYQKYKK